MRREEREAILRDVPRRQSPRERQDLLGVAEDLRSIPLRGRPLPLRLRNFRPSADSYLASLGGPLPYMLRLRQIDEHVAAHERLLEGEWRRLAAESAGHDRFERRWRELVERWSFDEVNDLIDRHNRYYPVESRLPMDPRRGDFALVNGEDYRRRHLDAAWALQRYPADLAIALRPD